MSLSRRAFVAGAAGAGAIGIATLGSNSAVATSSLTFNDRVITLEVDEELTSMSITGDVTVAWEVPDAEVSEVFFIVTASNDDIEVEDTYSVTGDNLDSGGTGIEPRLGLTGEGGLDTDYFEPGPGGDISRTFDLDVHAQVRVGGETTVSATASDEARVTVQKETRDGGGSPDRSASIAGGKMHFVYTSE